MKDSGSNNKKKLTRAKKVFFFVLTVFLFFVVFVYGYSMGQKGVFIGIGQNGLVNTENGKPTGVDFSLFWEAWGKLKSKSVQNADNQKMLEGAISGVLSSLDDPYTEYFTKIENKRFREDIHGEFYGIGIELVYKNNSPTVIAPIAESPAEKAGIKAGDIIGEVDSVNTSTLGFEETINKIRGAEGSTVKLTIIREAEDEPIKLEVVRKKIVVKSVEWELKEISDKKIFHIKLRQFGDDTETLFDEAVITAIKHNPDSIVLDLRNNPGGYLDTAVNIASHFIDGGLVVSEKGKNDEKKDYNAKGEAKLKDYKLVVLANKGSASASEILAGALRDRKGNKIIGEKTFGKGSVQELIELSDGSAVKITVAKWYTPSGKQINGEGIGPDIEVIEDEDEKTDLQFDRAMQYILEGK